MPRKSKINILFLLFFLSVISQNSFAQWTRTASTGAEWVYCFASVPVALNGQVMNYQYAGTDKGIFISTNYGSEWQPWSNGLSDLNITSIVPLISSTTLFAGSYGGVFRSTNLGYTWSSISSYQNGFTYPIVSSMTLLGSNLIAGTGTGTFLSTNYGVNWKKMNSGFADSAISSLLPVNNQGSIYLYAGTRIGPYVTPNYASRWYPARDGFSDGTIIYSLGVRIVGSRTELYAGTSIGVYKSTNFGSYWYQLGNAPIYKVNGFAVYGTNIFTATDYGVYRSTDGGINWTSIGMTEPENSYINSIAILGPYLMVGTYKAGIWRIHLSDITVSTEDNTAVLPKEFILNQNYPNPFNPTTTIKYSIAETPYPAPGQAMASPQRVTLKVFDLLGREVATLVNETKSTGTYTVNFDGSKLAAGVYFYTLQSGGNIFSRKMILLK